MTTCLQAFAAPTVVRPTIAQGLRKGQSVRIGGNADTWTTVERSTDGRTLRYVRHTADGFEVYRTVEV